MKVHLVDRRGFLRHTVVLDMSGGRYPDVVTCEGVQFVLQDGRYVEAEGQQTVLPERADVPGRELYPPASLPKK